MYIKICGDFLRFSLILLDSARIEHATVEQGHFPSTALELQGHTRISERLKSTAPQATQPNDLYMCCVVESARMEIGLARRQHNGSESNQNAIHHNYTARHRPKYAFKS